MVSLKSQDVKTQTSSPAYARFTSEDGMQHDSILQIKGDWGDELYKDHPESMSYEDFEKELYAEGYEDSIREGRREYGEYFEETEKKKSLRSVRLAKGLSQDELAELAGVRQYQVSRYEARKELPSMTTALRLCKVLGVDANTFFEIMGLKL